MLRIRDIRFLTASVLVAVFAITALRGWTLVRFGVVEQSLPNSSERGEILQPWLDAPGVASKAAKLMIATELKRGDFSGLIKRRDDLANALALKPMSSSNWLALAVARNATGQPPVAIADALSMSVVTGPNEGWLMTRRAVFGLPLWDILPQENRDRLIVDLKTSAPNASELAGIRESFASKSASARDQIRTALAAGGVSDSIIADLGL